MRLCVELAMLSLLILIHTVNPVPAAAGKPIKIGAVVESTGEAAGKNSDLRNAVSTAANMVNAAGGIEGRAIEVVLMNGGPDPDAFVDSICALIKDEEIIAGIGGIGPSSSTSAGEVFAKSKTPYIDFGGASPAVSPISEFVFMTPGSAGHQARALAGYAFRNLDYDALAVFKDVAADYGINFTDHFIHYANFFSPTENPAPLVLTYQTGDTDYSAQLTRLKSQIDKLGIQALVLPSLPRDAAAIASQARQFSIDLPFIGAGRTDCHTLIESGGPAVEGMLLSTQFHPDQPDLTETARRFVTEYHRLYKQYPGPYEAMAYDALMVVVEAVSAVIKEKGAIWWEKTELKEKRLATLDSLLKVEFQKTTQRFAFTKEGWPTKGQVWATVKNGIPKFHYFQPFNDFTPQDIEIPPLGK